MAEVKKPITVVTRVRPPIDGDDGADSVTVSGRSVSVAAPGGAARSFESDVAYGAHVPTSQLYNEQVEPLVQRVVAGYNAVVVAYGALRSGKAHTFFSDSAGGGAGLVPSAVDSLFSRLSAMSSSTKSLVTLSAFDVYSSQIIDLLHPQTKTGLQLLEHRAQGAFVEGIAELVVTTAAEVRALVKQALAVHDVLEGRITNQLGKAHTFLDLRVECIDNDNPSTIRYAQLRFLCLAGAGAVALKFNQGLQVLNKVVDTLAEGKAEPWTVPFGNSRLTKLMEPSLGGNALTLWITTLDASSRSSADSIHCLEVGGKVGRIRVSGARVNKNTLASSIRELREEIARVRGKLQLTQPGLYSHDIDPGNLKILRGLLAELERVKAMTWEKRVSRSAGWHESRRAALEQEGLLYTLTDPRDVEVPPQLVEQSRTLLASIVAARAALDDEETSLAEKRNLFKLRLDTVQRKAAASEGKDASESGGGASSSSVAELTRSDEKLSKLDGAISALDEKCRAARAELAGLEDEYRKVLTKLAVLEAKQRKLFLMGKDAAGLERLNRAQEWAAMRRDADSDPALAGTLATIAANADTQKRALASSADANAVREAAIQAIDSLREAQESSKRLEWERDALWGRLVEGRFKGEIALTRQQEHLFFLFRSYRSHFEENKDRMEARYRELLESSVKDALRLSEENNKLRAQLDARLKQI